MAMSFKDRFESIILGCFGSALFWIVLSGGALVTAWYAAHSASISGIPAYQAILLGAWVFLILAFSLYLLNMAVGWSRKPKIEPHDESLNESFATSMDESRASQKSAQPKAPQQPESMNDLIRSAARGLVEVPCGEGWLHAIAENDRLEIQNAVMVSRINFYNHADDIDGPYLEFVFTIFNMSVYEISIDDAIDGYITLNRKKLKKDNLELEKNNAQNCHVRGDGNFTLRQFLNDADLRSVMESSEDREFFFDNVIINIKGGENSPQVESKRLKMSGQVSRKYPVWNSYNLPYKISVDIPTNLTAETDSLKSQLEELKKYKLIFEIITKLQSTVQLYRDNQIALIEGGDFAKTERYIIRADLKLFFENNDVDPLIVKNMDVLLFRKDRDGNEREVALPESSIDIHEDGSETKINLSEMHIMGRRITNPYWLHCQLVLPPEYGTRISEGYFLRVNMDAMGQDLYSIDLDVNWKAARTGGSCVSIIPRK